MTIQQLLEMPIGERTGGGFVLTIAHTHKTDKYTVEKTEAEWTPSDGYIHNVTLTDKTGDILADLWTWKYNKVVRRNEIKIIVCEIQPSANATGKKLLVHEWERITCTADELPDKPIHWSQRELYEKSGPNWEAISRGKTKCRLACAFIQGCQDLPDERQRKYIAKLADWVMSEKDIYK